MTQQISFPSYTEIFRALMTPQGPHAYVPKLYSAINKLIENPDMDNWYKAKRITKNPVIVAAIDAIAVAIRNNRNTDLVEDIQYGVIATLTGEEYTQTPWFWLIDKIEDADLQYNVLNYYRIKYTAPNYDKNYYALPVNLRKREDFLSKSIIEIYLKLITHKKTPIARTEESTKTVSQLSDEFIKKIQKNPQIKHEIESSYAKIFKELQKIISNETGDKNRAKEYIVFAKKLIDFVPNKKEAKRLLDNLQKLEQNTKQPDAYDKLKKGFGHAMDRIKQKADEIYEKPGVKKATKQTGETLESAARATVNAIDAGIKKLRKKANHESFNNAVDAIKRKWDEFMKQTERQHQKN